MIMSDLNIIKSVDMILSFIIQPINGSTFIKCCNIYDFNKKMVIKIIVNLMDEIMKIRS